jgi:hypothetical protein
MNPQNIVIPVPYKGVKYEIHIKYVMKPMVGYHVSILKNGKYAGDVKGVLGTIEEGKKEGSRMIVADYNTKASADAMPEANLATAIDTSPYENGTIKLTWIDNNDYGILHSKMFDSVEEALKNTYEKKNWLIFKLKQSYDNSYVWELLPYGQSKSYKSGMYISDKPLIKLFLFGLAATGAYFIGKAIYDKLKESSLSSPSPITPTITPTATLTPSTSVAKV